MKSVLSRLGLLAGLGLVIALGCKTKNPAPVTRDSPPRAGLQAARLDYVDSEAFDLLFETTLLNSQPVIVVQTDHGKPEWGPRLNAWIAAWNEGRQTQVRRVRGQIPAVPSVVVDGDSIREFRLLIDGLMGRVEESARAGTQWWVEKTMRERRVALLRPYSLRFHLDADDRIQLIFFHGVYAAYHKDAVRSLANPDGDESLEWSPGYCCSRSRGRTRKEPAAD
jgi:hypothetical protein